MIRGSALFDAIVALTGALRSRAGLRSPWEDTVGTPIFLGAEVQMMSECVSDFLVIGDVGPADQASESMDGRHRPATLGAVHQMEETARIICRAVAQTGDVGAGVMPALMTRARDLVDTVAAELSAADRIGPSLGLVDGTTYRHIEATFGGVTSVLMYTTSGTVIEAIFEISILARL